jgi:hypothetical protein
VDWQPAKTVSRLASEGLPKPALDAIFAVPLDKQPGYAGTQLGNVYTVFKIASGKAHEVTDTQRGSITNSLAQQSANSTLDAYLDAVKKQHKVEVQQKVNTEQ